MTTTAWILIGLVIAATTAAPFALIAVARRAGDWRDASRPAHAPQADSPSSAHSATGANGSNP